MKKSIAWHEDCLKNHKASLAESARRLAQAQVQYDRDSLRYQHDETTLERAKREGLTEYDRERYNVPRKKK